MAKLIRSYKGYKIKTTTSRDNSSYMYWVIKPSWSDIEPIWECDSMKECIDFIDSDN